MANLYPYAQKWATNNQLALAYYEYNDAIVKDYAAFVGLITELITKAGSINDYAQFVESYFNSTEVNLHYDTKIVVYNGVYTLEEFTEIIGNTISNQLHNIDANSISTIDPDVVLQDRTEKLSNIMECLQATLHSATVECAAAQAIAFGDSVTSRLSLFRDYVSSKFVSAYTDISNTIDNIAEELKTHINIRSYIRNRFIRNGIADGQDGVSFMDSYDETYTGSSSGFAAILHAGKNIVETGWGFFTSACSVVMRTFGNLIQGAANLITKVTQYIVTHTINPEEITAISNPKGNHTIGKFFTISKYDIKDKPDLLREIQDSGEIHLDFTFSEVILKYDEENQPWHYLNNINENFEYLTTKFKEKYPTYPFNYNPVYLTNLTNIQHWLDTEQGVQISGSTIHDILIGLVNFMYEDIDVDNTYPINTILDMIYYKEEHPSFQILCDVLVKVKPVDYFRLGNGCYTPLATHYDAQEIISAINKVSDDDSYYTMNPVKDGAVYWLTPSVSTANYETYVYACSVFSSVYSYFELYMLKKESEGIDLSTYTDSVYYDFDLASYFATLQSANISNADFFNLFAEGKIFNFSERRYDDLTLPYNTVANMMDNIFAYRREHQLSYPFFPYNTRGVDWNDCSWLILSDYQVQSYLENWLTKAIVTAIAVYVAVKVFKKVKLAVSRLQAIAAGAEWNATEAASKGVLTTDILKASRKANLRAKIANWLTGGLLVATTSKFTSGLVSNTNNGEVSVDLSPIVTLITGE